MRLLSAAFFGIAPLLLTAQFVTYYVVPPSQGCDGLWAVNGASLQCGTAPYQYLTQPDGCLQMMGWTYNGDTVFVPLCDLPCTFIIASSDGSLCGGDVEPGTAVPDAATVELRVRMAPDGITVTTARAMPAGTLRLVDSDGRTRAARTVPAGGTWHLDPPPAPGAYILVFDGGDVHVRRSLIWAP